VHPVEWSIGEASGSLAVNALAHNVPPRAVRSNRKSLEDFQAILEGLGVLLHWPLYGALKPGSRRGYRPPPSWQRHQSFGGVCNMQLWRFVEAMAGFATGSAISLARADEQRTRTFVLVHGAWHGGWCWGRVAGGRAAGAGASSHDADLDRTWRAGAAAITVG
jgi:hypothetical protein